MVMPLREVPGTTARAWARPMAATSGRLMEAMSRCAARGVFGEPHEDSDDDQHGAHDEGIAPRAFGLFVEEESGDADGDGADGEEPEQLAVVFEFLIAADAHAEALGDDLVPIAGEIEEDGEQGADVQGDIEIEAFELPAEEPGSEVEMGGAGNGQKFGQTLDDGQDNHLEERH